MNPSALVLQIIHHRSRKQISKRRTSSRCRKIVITSLLLTCLAGVFLVTGVTIVYAFLTAQLPSPDLLPLLLDPPNGLLLHPTRLYDRSGLYEILTLENPIAKQKKYLSYIDLPEWLIQATIARLDPNFWNHSGFSMSGLGTDAHSTLAQRLVVELLLWNEPPGLRRAIRERLLAAQVTARFGREKVLEWFLNSANFGHLAYGVDAGAWVYFNKSAVELNLAESAALIAILEAPALNPLDAPGALLERQKQVLHAMLEQGMISQEQWKEAAQEKLQFRRHSYSLESQAPAFTNLVLEQLASYLGRERLYRGGFKIITTLDYDLQKQVECATKTQLDRISNPSEAIDQSADCPAARFLPTIPISHETNDLSLASNVVVLDPSSGEVIAMIGEPASEDPAHLPGHPPGSLFTPFIYLTAFARGFSPASLVWDIPSALPAGLTDVTNFDGAFHGPIRLRVALANDYLIPAVQVIHQVGADNVWRIARQLGLSSLQLPEGTQALKLPLQGGEVTLLDISRAYGVFANQGVLVGWLLPSSNAKQHRQTPEPMTIRQVTDVSGRMLLNCEEPLIQCEQVYQPIISSQLAYLVTHVLSDEAARWPSLGHPNFLEVGRPASEKIGQTLEGKDVWTVGYTPQLLVGVWVGSKVASPVQRLSPNLAAGIWHALIKYASQNHPYEDWSVPPGIAFVDVCDPSGMLPTTACPNVVKEVFQIGDEPTQADTLFRSVQINRETGQLATVFTPPQLIEEKVYMVVPPFAVTWASQFGLPILPNTYDTVSAQSFGSEGAKIISPKMFAEVSGQVPVLGTANGEDFAYYRLLIGQGLNPEKWLQIGEDFKSPVKSGVLAHWDTRGLQGLYVLQLQVVHQNGKVETALTQVTIDNQSPVIAIRYPHQRQMIRVSEEPYIALQADVSDDLGISEVKFFLDGHWIATLLSSPFIVPWESEVGDHRFRVQAMDRAGNVSEMELHFSVVR